MKRQLYLNEICDSLDKERDQLLHLRRLYTIKPTFKIKSPKKPKFLIQNNSRLLKRAETQYNIDVQNMILRNRLSYINNKDGPYNQNYLRPKTGLPAFKKSFINYSFQDIERMRKIVKENIKFYNKVNNMKSYYDFETMTEEAKNQVKYMNNLLKQNRFINRPPSLNYIDIDKYRKLIEAQNEEEELYDEGDNNDVIEEDVKEEEKENEEKKENVNNNDEDKNKERDNLNIKKEEKKNNISTTNNSTKEKNIIH